MMHLKLFIYLAIPSNVIILTAINNAASFLLVTTLFYALINYMQSLKNEKW